MKTMDRKRDSKKKAEKTLMEKRAAQAEKRKPKVFLP